MATLLGVLGPGCFCSAQRHASAPLMLTLSMCGKNVMMMSRAIMSRNHDEEGQSGGQGLSSLVQLKDFWCLAKGGYI